MTERQTRRVFTREFKIEAVEHLLNSNKPTTEIARDLGIRVELSYLKRAERKWKLCIHHLLNSIPDSEGI